MSILFPFALGFLNRIRGGCFKEYWNNTLGWKFIALLGVICCSYLLLRLPLLISVMLGTAWFLFMLPTYGAWIDMGNFSPEYNRGGILKYPYIFLGEKLKLNQNLLDLIMLSIRGLLCILIFGVLAYHLNSIYILLLTIPASMLWSVGYWISWKINIPQYSEFLSGFLLGFIIILVL